jgi:serine protease Do
MKKEPLILANIILCVSVAFLLYLQVFGTPLGILQILAPKSSGSVNNQPDGRTVLRDDVSFVDAARAVTPGVVHIKSSYGSSVATSAAQQMYGPYDRGIGRAMASGSGVIISVDGYIATNNHVVEKASEIKVVLTDRREFTANLVGRDPNTDLALLKINAAGLPAVNFGNSDNVQVGEWVLAVGYPFSLNTTVTAGIVSAKGRSIGIINRPSSVEGPPQQSSAAIESFIQTDAAINPGNSGGALVNTSGELIGINTAIASLTGSYAGYAFAIPVNLAQKILDDIKQFGTVRRGILGVSFPAPSAEDVFLRQQGINPGTINGVYITDIQTGSAAAAAGLKGGDIIQSIDGARLSSSSEFSERIARHRPNDRVRITYLRGGKENSVDVTLKGEEADRSTAANAQSLKDIYKKLGASFAPVKPAIKEQLNLKSGVLVTEVYKGGFFEQLGIPAGTIIAYINGREMFTARDIENALLAAGNSRIQVLAIAPDGSRVAFNFSLGA